MAPDIRCMINNCQEIGLMIPPSHPYEDKIENRIGFV